MLLKVFLVLSLTFLLHPGYTNSQTAEKRFYHITSENGLSQSTIQSIHQDYEGYMWFGSQFGLNRYDGNDIKTYHYSADDSFSIGDDAIRVIYEDRKRNLWIGTQTSGINLYDRKKDHFIRFTGKPDELKTVSSNTIWAILEDIRDNLWVGTAHGLNIMNRDEKTFTRIFHDPDDPTSLTHNQITALFEDRNGSLWIGTANGFNLYNPDDRSFTRYQTFSENNVTKDLGIIRTIYEDNRGTLWIGTHQNGLFRFDTETESFDHFNHRSDDPMSIGGNSIFDLLEDSHGNFWIGTSNHGLNIFDRDTEQFYRFEHDVTNPYSINNNAIHDLYESREDILWAGTFAGGVNFLELKPETFTHFKNQPNNPQSLSNNVVQSIYQDRRGNIWIGTDGGGLNLFDPATNHFRHYVHEPGNSNSLSTDVVLKIYETDEGLWLGTYAGGVDLFDPEKNSFQNYRHRPDDPQSLGSNFIYDIHESDNGLIWVATNNGGIATFDRQAGEWRRYMADPENPDDNTTISHNDVRAIYEDSFGDVWIGAYEGNVDRYDSEQERFINYDLSYNNRLVASAVQYFYEDSQNRFWIGTRGAGLMVYDRENDQIIPFDFAEEQPGNMIQSIVEDNNGNLWMGTNNGLSRLNPDTGEATHYGREHGLQSREFNPGAVLKDSDGRLYFGSVSGFVRFHPDSVRVDTVTYPVVLTDFQIFNESVPIGDESFLENHISQTERLVLPHTATVFSFGYTALNFSAFKGDRFAYKLEGFDENWNSVETQRMATYTNLNPGEYRFMVRSANKHGVWGEPTVALPVIITPPFWQTWWFYSLLVLGLILGVTTVFRMRVQKIRKHNILLERQVMERTEKLQQANAAKNKLFSIVAHDLRNIAGNVVTWADLVKMSADDDNIEEVKEYTGYLYQSTNLLSVFLKNLLEWARTQKNEIVNDPKTMNLKQAVDEVFEQETAAAKNKKIELRCNIGEDVNVYADPNMVSVILRNLLHNALKFTPEGGIVETGISVTNGAAEISISDTGVGMDTETIRKILSEDEHITTTGTLGEKGTGLGLDLCRDFVEKNNGKLTIESEPGKGTTIRFTLPLPVEAKTEWVIENRD